MVTDLAKSTITGRVQSIDSLELVAVAQQLNATVKFASFPLFEDKISHFSFY